MPNLGKGALARYGNFYRGDDDFFTHALILKNGECWLLGQGLTEVFVRVFKARAGKFRQLKAALSSIPAAWPRSSYDTNGYNFIPDVGGANENEIAVFGKQPGQKIGQYYVPPAGSQVEALVKAIANI